MRMFVVSLYLSIQAENEDEARKFLESIEIESPYKENIFWSTFNSELEEAPDLSR